MTLDNVFLALHVLGAMMWIGGLFAVMAFLDATLAEPDPAARARLVVHLRQAAMVPDIALAIALVFGAHWLMRFKLYETHFMQAKLALVVLVIGLHVVLRRKVGAIKRGEATTPPPLAWKPLLSATVLGILLFVITRWPT